MADKNPLNSQVGLAQKQIQIKVFFEVVQFNVNWQVCTLTLGKFANNKTAIHSNKVAKELVNLLDFPPYILVTYRIISGNKKSA